MTSVVVNTNVCFVFRAAVKYAEQAMRGWASQDKYTICSHVFFAICLYSFKGSLLNSLSFCKFIPPTLSSVKQYSISVVAKPHPFESSCVETQLQIPPFCALSADNYTSSKTAANSQLYGKSSVGVSACLSTVNDFLALRFSFVHRFITLSFNFTVTG